MRTRRLQQGFNCPSAWAVSTVPYCANKKLARYNSCTDGIAQNPLFDKLVIADRRWKEVTAAFSFPSTATNASFVLRKYYMSLLYHYEQIYVFGSKGWNYPQTAGYAPSASTFERSIETMLPYWEAQTSAKRRKRINGGSSSSAVYPSVVGVIDGKFEHGYFVTVTVGGLTKLKGVLYHSPDLAATRIPLYSGMADDTNVRVTRHRRHRKKLSTRDPTHPKPNRSGYNFFFAEQHARLKPLHPGKDREISKMIGDLWNKLTDSEKAVYQERGVKDKERYKTEMAVYRERLKIGQSVSTAMPILQRPAEQELEVGNPDAKVEMDDGYILLCDQNDSSIDGEDDSEGKDLDDDDDDDDDDDEIETSLDVGQNATGSFRLAEPLPDQKDGFELRRRDQSLLPKE
ncbi:high mobility group B protein 15-like isoform X4 [Ananas comosus]|nr:high mobility group B protein 15-like isoform X4 [Ananas comosus]